MSQPTQTSISQTAEYKFAAIAAMLLAAVLLSMSGLLVRSMESAHPGQINFYRSIAFCLVIGLGYFVANGATGLKRLANPGAPVIFASLILGMTGALVPFALTATSVANNVIALGATPFITMVLAWFFLGETVPRAGIGLIALAVAGIMLMVFDGLGSGQLAGNALAVLVAVGFSAFVVTLRANRSLDMTPCLFFAGFIVLGSAMVTGDGNFAVSTHDLLLCLVWGGILSGLSHWIFVLASRYLQATELSLFHLVELALAPFWVWLVFSERPQQLAIVGALMVIVAITINMFATCKRTGNHG